jgi:two-component system chemotaxis response regulator CheY
MHTARWGMRAAGGAAPPPGRIDKTVDTVLMVQGGIMAKHILIVDDSKTVRNLVAFIMKKEGFKVTTAEDGLDGLEKLYSASEVDLIVSDVNMPRMDGLTFIKTVREQEAYRDIPIVVLSTEGQDKDIQTGLTVGANLYMVKPAQPEKLVRNVKMLLG